MQALPTHGNKSLLIHLTIICDCIQTSSVVLEQKTKLFPNTRQSKCKIRMQAILVTEAENHSSDLSKNSTNMQCACLLVLRLLGKDVTTSTTSPYNCMLFFTELRIPNGRSFSTSLLFLDEFFCI